MFNKCISVVAFAALCAGLVSCGGKSSSGSETTTGNSEMETNSSNTDMVLRGVLVDSAVEGVSYSTVTQSGITNSLGEFSYLAGEQVIFSIGATQLPIVDAAPMVSPVDIAAPSSNPGNTAINIARLLQSLDIDGNPDNGITISADAAAHSTFINFDVSILAFANTTSVINLVANSGSVNTSLIAAESAESHLNETLGLTTMLANLTGFYDATVDGDREFYWQVNSDGSIAEYALSNNNENCFNTSNLTLTFLGGDLFALERSSGTQELSIARQNGNLLLNSVSEDFRLEFPLIARLSASDLVLCDQMSN